MKRTLTVGLAAAAAATTTALTLLAAACGDDTDVSESIPSATDSSAGSVSTSAASDPPATDPPQSTAPSTTAVAPPTTQPADVPQRIVSLSPTHTEILFAIGAGEQVAAVDSFSNHPKAADAVRTDLSALEPNIEAISGYEPDLVIVQDEGPIVKQLRTLGIETWIGPAPAGFDDVYTQIEQLGARTGHVGEAAELVGQMQADLDELTSDLPELARPLTYYHELDDTYFSVTSNTFIGSVYNLFGLRNIADEVEGDSGGYPQLNAEFIVSESPDLIFLADTVCCGETADTVAARDGWGAIAAVENGLVFEMNDDIASRWGPRIVDYAREVRSAVDRAAALQPES